MGPRPNPFTSAEGCFLSRTLGAVFFLVGFCVGLGLGYLFFGSDGARFGAAIGAVLVGWMPWRRWLVRKIKQTQAEEEGNAPD